MRVLRVSGVRNYVAGQGRQCKHCTVHQSPVALVEYLISRFERAHHAKVALHQDLWESFRGAVDARPPDPNDVYTLEEARKVCTDLCCQLRRAQCKPQSCAFF